jgi:hypothetical protein
MKSGMLFYPCSMDFDSFKETWKSSEFYLESDFYKQHNLHVTAAQHIVESAKIYIMENWEKVTDWSNINLNVYHRKEKKDYYFSPKRDKKGTHSKIFEKILGKDNPLKGFDKIVLDPTDGDLSVTIKGKEFLWIKAEAVITIAHYIETFLNPKV